MKIKPPLDLFEEMFAASSEDEAVDLPKLFDAYEEEPYDGFVAEKLRELGIFSAP